MPKGKKQKPKIDKETQAIVNRLTQRQLMMWMRAGYPESRDEIANLIGAPIVRRIEKHGSQFAGRETP